jgi:hypothetical protein
MPLDQAGWDPWEPPDHGGGFEGCYVVRPLPGPRGGYSRPKRWLVEQMRRDIYGKLYWFEVLCFTNNQGAREARISGGFLLRESNGR